MNQLLQFIFDNRSIFVFVLLEIFAFFLIYQTSNYHGTRFLNSSNRIAAGLMETSDNISDYVSLKGENEVLADENARLREELRIRELQLYRRVVPDGVVSRPEISYDYLQAEVIDNNINNANNFITIDKGISDSVREGSAVINTEGVVGIVRNSGTEYSVVYSMLHSSMIVSARLQSTGDIASAAWDGNDYRFGELRYLPRHVAVSRGDTVVTSGFNSVFPEGIPIGIVDSFDSPEESAFHNVRLRLSVDFSRLSHVYVVTNRDKPEIDSVELELKTGDIP